MENRTFLRPTKSRLKYCRLKYYLFGVKYEILKENFSRNALVRRPANLRDGV